MSLPHREWPASRPRRRSRVVDDVVVDEGRGVDELDDRRIVHRLVAPIPAQTSGHQKKRRTSRRLPATGLDIPTDLRDQVDARLDLTGVRIFDCLEVLADRLEDLGQLRGGG